VCAAAAAAAAASSHPAQGYGDLHAYNTAEALFVVIYLFCSICIAAYIVGTITLLVVRSDEKTGRYRCVCACHPSTLLLLLLFLLLLLLFLLLLPPPPPRSVGVATSQQHAIISHSPAASHHVHMTCLRHMPTCSTACSCTACCTLLRSAHVPRNQNVTYCCAMLLLLLLLLLQGELGVTGCLQHHTRDTQGKPGGSTPDKHIR
jgi:hypothetical protein